MSNHNKSRIENTQSMENQRKELLEKMDQYLSDDLKKAIQAAYKLSKNEPPTRKLSFTDESNADGNTL